MACSASPERGTLEPSRTGGHGNEHGHRSVYTSLFRRYATGHRFCVSSWIKRKKAEKKIKKKNVHLSKKKVQTFAFLIFFSHFLFLLSLSHVSQRLFSFKHCSCVPYPTTFVFLFSSIYLPYFLIREHTWAVLPQFIIPFRAAQWRVLVGIQEVWKGGGGHLFLRNRACTDSFRTIFMTTFFCLAQKQ